MLDLGCRRTAVAPAHHALDAATCSFEHGLDPAVTQVLDPSFYARSFRLVTGVGTEIDVLYSS